MMKFASFENIVAAIYNYLPGTKDDYGKGAQTAVAFSGGYLAGILCAIVSHPADVMVSKLNANRTAGEAFGAAMGRIYKDIGFGGLWNGLPVRIVMIVSDTAGWERTALLTYLPGHTYRSTMDDLRLVQDLRWSPNHWWWSTQGDCEGLNTFKSCAKSQNDGYDDGGGRRQSYSLLARTCDVVSLPAVENMILCLHSSHWLDAGYYMHLDM